MSSQTFTHAQQPQVCRICLNTDDCAHPQETLNFFCLCQDRCHHSCLLRWVETKLTPIKSSQESAKCEVCLYTYSIHQEVLETRIPISQVERFQLFVLVILVVCFFLMFLGLSVILDSEDESRFLIMYLLSMGALGVTAFIVYIYRLKFIKKERIIKLNCIRKADKTPQEPKNGHLEKAKLKHH